MPTGPRILSCLMPGPPQSPALDEHRITAWVLALLAIEFGEDTGRYGAFPDDGTVSRPGSTGWAGLRGRGERTE